MLFRKDMIFGRALRYQGRFAESLAHLESALKATEQSESLVFDEDRRDLICDFADTLRELKNPASTERLLRAEITWRDSHFGSPSGRSLLELSAEVLFAQEGFEEADMICLDVQVRPDLLKVRKAALAHDNGKDTPRSG